MTHNNYPLTVYYDGSCHVCENGMKRYRSLTKGRLIFIDISADGFIAEEHGRSIIDFQAKLHIKDAQGRFFTDVDALLELWRSMPSPFYRFLEKVVSIPGVYFTVKTGYSIFAKHRHKLSDSYRLK